MNQRQFCVPPAMWKSLETMLFTPDYSENFSFGLARPFRRRSGLIYILEDLTSVRRSDYEWRSRSGLRIDRSTSNKLNAIARDAAEAGLVPVHFHSHPPGCDDFSGHDDANEEQLHQWLRSVNQPLLISVVVPYRGHPTGRLWVEGQTEPLMLRQGLRPVSVYEALGHGALDRQGAFGPSLVAAANLLSVAMIGVGGIGMPVVEQLVRCGFRSFVLVDYDAVEVTNLNRLNGAFAADIGKRKIVVAARLIRQCAESLGTSAEVQLFPEDIYTAPRRVEEMVRQCDLVLALTDNQASRIRALALAMEGGAEFLSAGVDIRLSPQGTIEGLYAEIVGGERFRFCPVCAGRLDPAEAAIEVRKHVGGMVMAHAMRAGYLPDVPAPAVMSLNSTAAGMLCLEIQRRVSGLGQRDLIQVDWQSGSVRTIERGDLQVSTPCSVCGRRRSNEASEAAVNLDHE